jgi:TonB family protein
LIELADAGKSKGQKGVLNLKLTPILFIAILFLAVTNSACSRSQPVIELATVEKISAADNKTLTASPSPGSTLQSFTPPAKARFFEVSEGVIRGAAVKKVQPQYPLEAQAKGVRGNVRVRITIESIEGKVVKAEVISGPRLLRAAALQAAKEWTFKPANDMDWVYVVGTLEFKFPPQ